LEVSRVRPADSSQSEWGRAPTRLAVPLPRVPARARLRAQDQQADRSADLHAESAKRTRTAAASPL